jgi:spermidine synthase
MATSRRLFIACYGASGAAALVYQVVWVRLLTLAFGHTVASSSIVLAAFMCGLALGAWIAGRVKLAPQRALVVYAALELLIAMAAIVLPAVLSQFEPMLAWAYADGTLPARFTLVRAAMCFLLLGVPAAAMGATFPVAVTWFVDAAHRAHPAGDAHTATRAGVLYAANTAGAAMGALAAGFWLIPLYGARASTWLAVALNVLAAAGALWIRQGAEAAVDDVSPAQPRDRVAPRRGTKRSAKTGSSPVRQPFVAAGAAALSGFAALVFEVAWTRLIALIIGPTTYAFALMAASFIVGIAAGSTLGVRIARGSTQRAVWLAAMLTLSAAGTLAAAWFTALEVPLIVARTVSDVREFGPLLVRQTLLVGLLLTTASVTFGATFTLALATASPRIDTAARDTSVVYTANTVGAVAGSLAAGFLLLPRLGLASTFMQTSRILMVAGAVFAAAMVYQRTARRGATLTALGAACLFAATFALPSWSQALLSSGFYKYARQIDLQDLDITLRAGRLEYYKEGPAGTVSVKRLGGTRSLAIDGKVDASDGADMLTQRLLGLLPTVLHPNPQDALVIGLGSGVTAHAMMASSAVRRLDIVEISPEVVEAAALFDEQNGRVLNADGVRLLVGDGRSHLQLTSRKYDVIVSEPSNPWMAGVAALFTREFFEAVRSRLTPGGIFCQWAHTYEIESEDLRSIVRTFASVFPHGTLWLVGDGDLLLIGAEGRELEQRLAGVGDRLDTGSALTLLSDSGVAASSAPFFLLSLYAGGPRELAAFGDAAAIQSDDRMSLEFTAARAMYAPPEGNAPMLRTRAAGAVRPAALAATLGAATAADWVARGEAALKAEAFEMAHESFRHAATLDSRDYEALRGGVTASAAAGRVAEQLRWLRERAAAEPGNPAVRTALSYVLAVTGDIEAAIAEAFEATRLDPDSAPPLEQLASVLADAGDPRLPSVAGTLFSRFPARDDSRFYHAAALFVQNRHDEAERAVVALVGASPRHARAQNLRGIICAAKGDHAGAIAAFQASLEADPRDTTVYVNLGNAYLERGDVEAARSVLSEAVALDPQADAARGALRAIADRLN